MKILLYANKNIDNNYVITKEIANYLVEKNAEIVISKEMEPFFSEFNYIVFEPEISEKINLLIVLGGDGTFLSAAHDFYKYHIPYLGLNLGRVGYLTEGDRQNCYNIIDKVLENRFKVESKPLLSIKVVSDKGYENMIGFKVKSVNVNVSGVNTKEV